MAKGKPLTEMDEDLRRKTTKAHNAQMKIQRLKELENACWVRKQVLKYFSAHPPGSQTEDGIAKFLKEFPSLVGDGVTLSKLEVLQLINLRPTTLVEMYRIIEECEQRMSEEQVEALLELVQCTVPVTEDNLTLGEGGADEGEDVEAEGRNHGETQDYDEGDEEEEDDEEGEDDENMQDGDFIDEESKRNMDDSVDVGEEEQL